MSNFDLSLVHFCPLNHHAFKQKDFEIEYAELFRKHISYGISKIH